MLVDPGTRSSIFFGIHISEGCTFRSRLHGYLAGFTAYGKQLGLALRRHCTPMQYPRVDVFFQAATM